MTSELYVFAPRLAQAGGLNTQVELCGRIRWHDKVGTFRYAKEWLELPYSYALDPVNLPLVEGDRNVTVNGGVPGVLADAGPDGWGTVLLERMRGVLPTPLEALRLTSGSGVGALRFSQSRTKAAPSRSVLARTTLDELERAARALDAGLQVAHPELEEVFYAGSGLGGARPKVLVSDAGREWIAKFPRKSDALDIPILEAACLTLAARAGLEVPGHRLVTLNGRQTLLVERFDRAGGAPLHYMSFHAMLSAARVGPADAIPPGPLTYSSLGVTCRNLGVPAALPTLFRRMLFNVCIANTDDHLRNHGLLFDGSWRHAPTFDLVSIGGPAMAIGIGMEGRARSIENALSATARFGLSEEQARQILSEVQTAVATMEPLLLDLGMPAGDAEVVARRCM